MARYSLLLLLLLLTACVARDPREQQRRAYLALSSLELPSPDYSVLVLPTTKEEAAAEVERALPAESLRRIAAARKEDLIHLHHTLGRWIRNNFGLWDANTKLLADCSPYDPYLSKTLQDRGQPPCHPDQASSVILDALWDNLQPTGH